MLRMAYATHINAGQRKVMFLVCYKERTNATMQDMTTSQSYEYKQPLSNSTSHALTRQSALYSNMWSWRDEAMTIFF